jgi:hypothetical protein
MLTAATSLASGESELAERQDWTEAADLANAAIALNRRLSTDPFIYAEWRRLTREAVAGGISELTRVQARRPRSEYRFPVLDAPTLAPFVYGRV